IPLAEDKRVGMPYGFVDFPDANRFARIICSSLPSEAQWEYAYRAGSQTVSPWGNSAFPWGDSFENQDRIEKFLFDQGEDRFDNGFGLRAIFQGEWCLDSFLESYSGVHATDEASEDDGSDRVVRGGAAGLCPWQENTHCVCLMSPYREPRNAG